MENLERIEISRMQVINKIKAMIEKRNGNCYHDWEYITQHHGWTYWHVCKLCGKTSDQDRELSEEKLKEKCHFFNKRYVPNISCLKKYCG